MSLAYDPRTSKLYYNGQEVGRYEYQDGRARVTLNLTYECDADYWIVPISYFDLGLSKLPQETKEVICEIETPEDSIEREYEVDIFLTEKTVKRNGYAWRFHKQDDDPWPSSLHAHDYEKGLILDAITGDIYDKVTRKHCKDLKKSHLAYIHAELRKSDDFKARMAEWIDKTPSATLSAS
jgi:hypothetical protein